MPDPCDKQIDPKDQQDYNDARCWLMDLALHAFDGITNFRSEVLDEVDATQKLVDQFCDNDENNLACCNAAKEHLAKLKVINEALEEMWGTTYMFEENNIIDLIDIHLDGCNAASLIALLKGAATAITANIEKIEMLRQQLDELLHAFPKECVPSEEDCSKSDCYDKTFDPEALDPAERKAASLALMDCLVSNNREVEKLEPLKAWLKDFRLAFGDDKNPVDYQSLKRKWEARPMIEAWPGPCDPDKEPKENAILRASQNKPVSNCLADALDCLLAVICSDIILAGD